MHTPVTRQDSNAWIFQVWAAFIISFGMTLVGIYLLPVDFWIKGYFAMGILFTVGSTFSLAKTLRDRFEEEKITNRVASAKTEKILHDYEFKDTLRSA
jgi:hypothetical protein